MQLEQLPLETADIAKATKSDTILSQVYYFIQDGWSKHKSDIPGVAKVLHPHFVRILQLTVQSGSVYFKWLAGGNSQQSQEAKGSNDRAS